MTLSGQSPVHVSRTRKSTLSRNKNSPSLWRLLAGLCSIPKKTSFFNQFGNQNDKTAHSRPSLDNLSSVDPKVFKETLFTGYETATQVWSLSRFRVARLSVQKPESFCRSLYLIVDRDNLATAELPHR